MFYFGIVYAFSFTVLALCFIYDMLSKRNYTYMDCIKSVIMVVTPVVNTILTLVLLWDAILLYAIIPKAVKDKLNKPIFKNK